MFLIQILLFFFFLWLLRKGISPISDSLSDFLIKYFVAFVACIIPTGFLLSSLDWINKPLAWFVFSLLFAFFIFVLTNFFIGDFTINSFSEHHKKNFPKTGKGSFISKVLYFFILRFATSKLIATEKFNFKKSRQKFRYEVPLWWNSLNILHKVIFGILIGTLLFTSIINLITVFVSFPNEWDSMTGHLVKCVYYLQNGNMNRVGGTIWSIDFYPRSLPTLQIFGYHLFHSEKGFKLIHYLSYWAFALASYGTAKKIIQQTSGLRSASIFVFLVTALLPTALIQATTTETDLVLTAYLSCLVYFMFCYKNANQEANAQNRDVLMVLITLTACIAFGHKITFLLITPAIAVVAIYTLILTEGFIKKIPILLAIFVIGLCLYVLPTGYISNMQAEGKYTMGNMVGPKRVMIAHGTDGYLRKEIIKLGTVNVGRYTSDFLNLDGIRSTETGKQINHLLRYFPEKFLRKFNLERNVFWVVAPFYLNNPPYDFFHERPYWGIISFGMVFPLLFFISFSFIKRPKHTQNHRFFVLFIAATIHFLSLCYTAPYDPIKGRYFMNMAVWCMPFLLLFFNSKSNFKTLYLVFCSLLISLSAIFIVSIRKSQPIFAKNNIFNISRMQQLLANRPDIYEAYRKFDELVPASAIVALGTTDEDFEYPLWGKDLSRKLIPLHPDHETLKPIPVEAEYLFYANGVFPFKEGDIILNETNTINDTPLKGNVFYLRRLFLKKNILKQNEL